MRTTIAADAAGPVLAGALLVAVNLPPRLLGDDGRPDGRATDRPAPGRLAWPSLRRAPRCWDRDRYADGHDGPVHEFRRCRRVRSQNSGLPGSSILREASSVTNSARRRPSIESSTWPRSQERVVVAGKSPVVEWLGDRASLIASSCASSPPCPLHGAAVYGSSMPPAMHITRAFSLGGGSAGPAAAGLDTARADCPSNARGHLRDARPGPNGFSFDYGLFEHASVNLRCAWPESPFRGSSPSSSRSPGATSVQDRSMWTPAHRAWQAFNIDEDPIARGLRGRNEVADREVNLAMGRPRCQRRRRWRD